MDQDQKVFQAAACVYHIKAGIGHTQHLFSALVHDPA